MCVFCWNIQGLKKAQAIPEAKFLINNQKPDITFLIETMVSDVNIQKLLLLLGFDPFDYLFTINHSGGLAVMWNNDNVHVSILSKDNRAIHLLLYDITLRTTSMLSGVYGHALIKLSTIIDLPGVLLVISMKFFPLQISWVAYHLIEIDSVPRAFSY